MLEGIRPWIAPPTCLRRVSFVRSTSGRALSDLHWATKASKSARGILVWARWHRGLEDSDSHRKEMTKSSSTGSINMDKRSIETCSRRSVCGVVAAEKRNFDRSRSCGSSRRRIASPSQTTNRQVYLCLFSLARSTIRLAFTVRLEDVASRKKSGGAGSRSLGGSRAALRIPSMCFGPIGVEYRLHCTAQILERTSPVGSCSSHSARISIPSSPVPPNGTTL